MSDADEYIDAYRRLPTRDLRRLRPKLRINCPTKGHLVAAVYETPWGDYFWGHPLTMTPRGRDELSAYEAETGKTVKSEPGVMFHKPGLLGPALAKADAIPDGRLGAGVCYSRVGCRCSVWTVDWRQAADAVAARQSEIVLGRESAWRLEATT
jgi:hypothetical protein